MNTSPDGMNNPDRELVRRAREIYAEACANVDAHTHARLATARRNAMGAAQRPSHKRIWLPAAGAMAACVLAVGVTFWRPASVPARVQGPKIAASDVELPLDADPQQMDLYQNLDFYQWLAQQPDSRASADGASQ